jgi:hypothetical protein
VFSQVPDDKKQTCELTVALKLAGEATDSRNKVASEAIRFFFVTNFFVANFFVTEFSVVAKVFFVTGTIVPIPIPCAGLPFGSRPDLFARKCRRGFPMQMQNGVWCCSQLLVAGSECVQ